jgi:hypothetical protein
MLWTPVQKHLVHADQVSSGLSPASAPSIGVAETFELRLPETPGLSAKFGSALHDHQ